MCIRDRVGPRARYDVDHVVAAAAEPDPLAAAQLEGHVAERLDRDALRVDRQRQVGERVVGVGVGAVLADDDLRPEAAQHARHDGVEGPQPRGVAHPRRQGDVDRAALGVGAAGVAGETGAREKHGAGLVDRDRQHAGVVPEHALHAVAVVGVDVDVRHLLDALVEEPLNRDARVVVDAEAGRGVRPLSLIHI